jgi:hypothetical protein
LYLLLVPNPEEKRSLPTGTLDARSSSRRRKRNLRHKEIKLSKKSDNVSS